MANQISIVVPVFNEAQTLKPLYHQISDVMAKMGTPYEVIFVDDGSTDASFEIMEEIYLLQQKISLDSSPLPLDNRIANSILEVSNPTFEDGSIGGQQHFTPQVTVIQFRCNVGKAAALAAGFSIATGEIIITMDADLQDDPNEIPKLVAKLHEGYDVVSGWKINRKDRWSKVLLSKIFNWTVCLSGNIKLHDVNCGLKAYRREVVQDIQLYGDLHRYIPVLAHQRGYRITEVQVLHHPRRCGKSKYGFERILRGFFDMLTVFFLTRYLKRPLHFFGTLGLGSLLAGIGINTYLAFVWFIRGGIGFRPLLMLGLLLMILGAQFFSVGLLGEMFTNRFEAFKQNYPIKTILR